MGRHVETPVDPNVLLEESEALRTKIDGALGGAGADELLALERLRQDDLDEIYAFAKPKGGLRRVNYVRGGALA